jgi:hypothetical protein
LNRTPPVAVREELRKEVGFGCPVEGCGNPYLTWHHFDPPWSVREHHEPGGMLALCRQHHDAADAGAYTVEQLHALKARGRDQSVALVGRFEWMRHRLLAVVGGTFYYETPIPVQLGERAVVEFRRDEQDLLLLNVSMPSTLPEPRMIIEDNFWIEVGQPEQLECPPSGRVVSVTYPNGDALRVEFLELSDVDALLRRYEHAELPRRLLEEEEEDGFPVTAVDIRMRVVAPDGTPVIDFDAQQTRVGGITMTGSMFVRGAVGMRLG